jgi:hypothetical protein
MVMTEKIYYVSWNTWLDQDIHTPWDFWFLSEGTRFKPRPTCKSALKPGSAMIAHAYETQNQRLLEEIQENFIQDVKLLALITAEDEHAAQQQVQNLFADAEFDRVMEIDQQQCDAILQLIDQTLKTKARIP